uniref:Transporter n=1 Tax=Photinus pyralis TaxID=7054 RepID=A0A1Y1M5C2_PHOPY
MTSNAEKFGQDNPGFQIENGENGRATKDSETKIKVDSIETERAQWGNGLEFLMSCIAMSVGLGNIWRFPFTAYENGGGAFLIPYIVVLIVIGRPLYYLEMALGQFTSRGNVQSFSSLSPAIKGIGYGQLLGSTCIATYYCSLMALTLFYLVSSFTSDLPWSHCKVEWETENSQRNVTCVSSKDTESVTGRNKISSSELWFTKEVLKEKEQINDGVGPPEWRLTLCLLVAWFLTFAVSVKGVKSSGKVSYFLALFPYVVMGALLIRAVTLEGSTEGMLYFVTPQWSKLARAEVWYAAVTQCFFSLNVGLGSIIMYSSYNSFDHNINRDALVVTTLDTFTSLLAGTTIFGILGNLAHELNVPVEDVVKSGGTGLAFISYPDAIAKFQSVPWLFAILFFIMLFVLGIGSLVALHGCANTMIMDNFPTIKPWKVSAATALFGFLVGLVYITPGGQFILTVVDFFGGNMVIFVFAIIEIVTLMWCYGSENFCNDLEFMTKQKVGIYWRITWTIITPLFLIIVFIYSLATLTRLDYGSYEISDLALGLGWAIVCVSVMIFASFFGVSFYKNRKFGFPAMIWETFNTTNWGPENHSVRLAWKEEKLRKSAEVASSGKIWITRKLNFLIGR